jgi:two-component system sensor histidine kinase KdpD
MTRAEQAWQNAWPRYAWAAASSVAITLATTPLHGYLDLANIVMLFLLGVVGVAMRSGRGPAALAAVLNVAAFDFFFVPPHLSFAVSDVQYLVTFAVMLVVGLLTGQLTAGLKFQARISSQPRAARAVAVRAHARPLRRAAERPGGRTGRGCGATQLWRAGPGAGNRRARPARDAGGAARGL